MPCYSPLRAFPIGIHEKSGKTKYKITSTHIDFLVEDRTDKHCIKFLKCNDQEDMKEYYASKPLFKIYDEFIEIPCGKCIGCRLAKSQEWASRCMLEASLHEHNHFLTLTYNNDHLPRNSEGIPTLKKSDVQNFIKRLRERYRDYCEKNCIENDKFRYFYCGEYGSENNRPHYHLLLFGLQLDDLHFESDSNIPDRQGNDKYYTSSLIDKAWSECLVDGVESTRDSLGFHILGDLTFESCAYVARYVMKKAHSDMYNREFYDSLNIVPEYINMSLKPGIGLGFLGNYDEFGDFILDENKVDYLFTFDALDPRFLGNSRKQRIPRYFEKILDKYCPERLIELKERRVQNALDYKFNKLLTLDVPYDEALDRELIYKIESLKSLKRDL